MSNKILVVDDEKNIADIIKFNLEKEGYNVLVAYDGIEAMEFVDEGDLDLVILDVMMPEKDGFQVLKEIRTEYNMPVLMLTAKEEEVDKVLGLELGADDYITKPFSMRELVARVKSNLRRVSFGNEPDTNTIIEIGEIKIDVQKYEVKKKGEVLDLTLREYELLKFLAESSGQVFTREQLLEEVWGYEYYGDIRTVDVTVRRLREKVEDKDGVFEYILTKRGVGYYFRR